MTNRQLLFSVTKKDFRVDTFRAGGKGGQNQNARDTGVRIVHLESGAKGEGRDQRSQEQNKKNAFRRLLDTPEWKNWFRIKVAVATSQLDRLPDINIKIEDCKFEIRSKGKWLEVNSDLNPL